MNEADAIAIASVLRLKEVALARAEVARWRAERNHASAMLEKAKLKLVLAQRASETGEDQMPLCAEAAARFFNLEVTK